MARNQGIDRLRQRKPINEDIDVAETIAEAGPTPEAAALAASEASRLSRCLGQLEEQKAQAVQAAYMEGYSYQELATRYAVPLNTMRTWLRRSLQKLKACLDDG